MSGGIFVVGLMTAISLSVIAAVFYDAVCRKTCMSLLIVAVIAFTASIIVSLSYPYGFEQLKAELHGDELIYLSMTTDNYGRLTEQDLQQLNVLKKEGFTIAESNDCIEYIGGGNERRPVRYYCEIMLKRHRSSKPSSSRVRYDELTEKAEN